MHDGGQALDAIQATKRRCAAPGAWFGHMQRRKHAQNEPRNRLSGLLGNGRALEREKRGRGWMRGGQTDETRAASSY